MRTDGQHRLSSPSRSGGGGHPQDGGGAPPSSASAKASADATSPLLRNGEENVLGYFGRDGQIQRLAGGKWTMGKYPLSEGHQNPVRDRPDHERNQTPARLTIDFPPRRAAMGRGPSAGWWRGRPGWARDLGFWVTLEGLFLPRSPLRQPFWLPPPLRCATGRKVAFAWGPPSSTFVKATADATSPVPRNVEDNGASNRASYPSCPMPYSPMALSQRAGRMVFKICGAGQSFPADVSC